MGSWCFPPCLHQCTFSCEVIWFGEINKNFEARINMETDSVRWNYNIKGTRDQESTLKQGFINCYPSQLWSVANSWRNLAGVYFWLQIQSQFLTIHFSFLRKIANQNVSFHIASPAHQSGTGAHTKLPRRNSKYGNSESRNPFLGLLNFTWEILLRM